MTRCTHYRTEEDKDAKRAQIVQVFGIQHRAYVQEHVAYALCYSYIATRREKYVCIQPVQKSPATPNSALRLVESLYKKDENIQAKVTKIERNSIRSKCCQTNK